MKVWLHHININHHDVAAMDSFYGDVMRQDDIPEMRSVPSIPDVLYSGALAFRVSEGGTQFHLTATDTGVGIRAGKEINPLERGHVAFRTDDIEAFKKHLEDQGIPYVDYGTTFTKQWTQIYFHDPAGTIIEVHQVVA